MKLLSALFSLIVLLLVISCNSRSHLNEKNYKLTTSYSGKVLQSGDDLTLQIHSKNEIDSVQYILAGEKLGSTKNKESFNINLTSPLGEHELTALIFYNGDSLSISKKLILYSNLKPKVFTYKIKNSFPHDPKAFTQGLEFYNDTLYEGTGMYGVSELRKTDLKTGDVLKKTRLERKYFGEGISIMNDKIFQLTWREGVGFIYNPHTFDRIESFKYNKSKEGWGLCNDGEVLYKSDGSDKIWIVDPDTFEEKYYINPVTNSTLATKVNELEWVNGKIYANTWQKDGVLIIDPTTGIVEGIIDFRGLKEKQTNEKADVLNGIAYNPNTNKLYVTGKYWDKIFEVEIVEK